MQHRRDLPLFFTVLMVVLAVGVWGSCAQQGQVSGFIGDSIDRNRLQFEFILGGSDQEHYWKQIKAGATAAGSDYGIDMAFSVVSDSSLQGDAIERIAGGNDEVSDRDSGAIVALTDPSVVLLQLQSLSAAGIPVSVVNTDPQYFNRIHESVVPVAYLGQSARVSANIIAKWLRETDSERVLCIVHRSDSPSLDELCSEVERIVEGEIELVTVRLSNVTSVEEYDVAIASRLQGIEDIDFVITLSAEIAEAISTMTASIGQDVNIGTLGINSAVSMLLQDRQMVFALSQQPFLQGYLAVAYLYLHIQYGIAPTAIPQLTGPQIFDSGTVTLLTPFMERGTR